MFFIIFLIIEFEIIFTFLKAYAITALMKIYAFEIVTGRKVDILPEVDFFPPFANVSNFVIDVDNAFKLSFELCDCFFFFFP